MKTLLVLLSLLSTAHAQTTLVARGSTWKYLDNGSNQGTAWRAAAFDDSTWSSGPAPLGYGDNQAQATIVSFGPDPNAKYITTYFRRNFQVANAAAVTSLQLELRRDDGAVVYINGTEVLRDAMPAGTITSSTFASITAGGDAGES